MDTETLKLVDEQARRVAEAGSICTIKIYWWAEHKRWVVSIAGSYPYEHESKRACVMFVSAVMLRASVYIED